MAFQYVDPPMTSPGPFSNQGKVRPRGILIFIFSSKKNFEI